MNHAMKKVLGSIVCFLIIGLVSCNSDEEIEEPFDKNHLVGKWQESGRNGIASINDNYYEFRDTFTFEQCHEGDCWDGIWEWIVDDVNTKIKFDYSQPTGGWWQEFEIAYLDGDNLEVTVFDYVEGQKDPVGGGVVINFTKLDQ
jgi:hypothetical protein